MKHSFADIKSDKALVCHKEHRCDAGIRTAWSVLLADGYLIDCGAPSLSEARAKTLAEIINAGGAEMLSRDALTKCGDSNG